jgi:hypothetical protein
MRPWAVIFLVLVSSFVAAACAKEGASRPPNDDAPGATPAKTDDGGGSAEAGAPSRSGAASDGASGLSADAAPSSGEGGSGAGEDGPEPALDTAGDGSAPLDLPASELPGPGPGADAPDRADIGPDAPMGGDLAVEAPADVATAKDAPGAPDLAVGCPSNQKACTTGVGTLCVPLDGCCLPGDCPGTCQTCGSAHTCVAALSQSDPTYRCIGTCDATGVCRSKQGQSCTAVSGGCVAGTTCSPENVCCDHACAGSCEACDVSGAEGRCTTLPAGASPHAGHSACTTTNATCAGSCSGASSTCTYPTVACSAATCSGAKYQPAGACADGACALPAQVTCTYACVASLGGCTGECTPGLGGCGNTGIPQLCDQNGKWQDKPACPAGASCVGGACQCGAGLTNCDGVCVNLMSDDNNCGACGNRCDSVCAGCFCGLGFCE